MQKSFVVIGMIVGACLPTGYFNKNNNQEIKNSIMFSEKIFYSQRYTCDIDKIPKDIVSSEIISLCKETSNRWLRIDMMNSIYTNGA